MMHCTANVRGTVAFRVRERGIVLERGVVLGFGVDREAEQHHSPDGHAIPGIELLHQLERVDLV